MQLCLYETDFNFIVYMFIWRKYNYWISVVIFLSTVSKHATHFEHSFLNDKCSGKMVNTPPSDVFNSFAISCNFHLWSAKMSVWRFLEFSWTNAESSDMSTEHHLCPVWTCLKSAYQLLTNVSNGAKSWITLIKPLLCLNSIFPIRKQWLYQHTNFMEVPVVSWLWLQEMDTATQVQILDETDCISHNTNILWKGMNPIILPPAMGK